MDNRTIVADAVVIGAGIAGLSIAAELSRTRRVLVVDPEATVAYHSSGRSAAVSIPWYGDHISHALTRISRTMLDEGATRSDGPYLTPRGLLIIAFHDHRGETGIDGGEELPDGQQLSPADAKTKVPILRADKIGSALYDPSVLDIHVSKLIGHYLRELERNSASILTGNRLRAAERRATHWQLDFAEYRIECALAVNAAGAWADEVARTFGATPIGLRPMKRTVNCFSSPSRGRSETWPLTLDHAGSFYFKPHEDQVIASLNEETPVLPQDVTPRAEDLDALNLLLERFTLLTTDEATNAWAGLRTFSPDRTIVLGSDPTVPTLFWYAGQGGVGVQTAPAASRALLSLIDDGQLPCELQEAGVTEAAVSPRRFRAAAPSP